MIRILAVLSFLILSATGGKTTHAAIFTSTVDLVPATPTENRLSITVLNMNMPIGSTTTDFSGNMQLALDFDLSGNVTGFRIDAGDFTATPWSIPLGGPFAISATETGGTFATIGGVMTPGGLLSPVTGTGFDGAQHALTIDEGVVTAPAGLDPTGFTYDFSVPGNELSSPGAGPGTLSVTQIGSSMDFDIRLEIPFNFEAEIDASNSLQIVGLIAAEGVVTVPESSSVVILGCLAIVITAVHLRRRRATAVSPIAP